jgi:hypothetical protein
MFLGHFAVGFAAKRSAPAVSLGLLFLAAQFLDLLWPTLLFAGVEQVVIAPGDTALTPLAFTHYPVSHSLLAVLGWGALFALAHRMLGGTARAALVLGALVVSHWLLDALVHRPDLPLTPWGAARVGLGLWNAPLAAIALESALFVGGLWLYARRTEAEDATGRWALWALVASLVLIQVGNLMGEPPPSVIAIAWVGQAQWLLVLWAFWIDRHRRARV